MAKLNEYADSMIVLADTKDFVKTKFVDRLLYTDQVKDVVKKKLGVSDDDDINQVSVSDMLADDSDTDGGGKIAVYYAYGSIVDGAVSPMSGDHEIDGQKMCRDLEELAKDDDIKAVVLRVNSGGGSRLCVGTDMASGHGTEEEETRRGVHGRYGSQRSILYERSGQLDSG